jgi:3-oxoacyl-[acyl-carrier-protein] synthase-1
MEHYYLNDMEIACSLGANKVNVFQNLMKTDVAASEKKINLISGKSCIEMTLPFELPIIPDKFQKYQSKNNQLLYHLFQGIQHAVSIAIQKYSKQRIGVVMGTSSSGMKEGEEAYAYYTKNNVWPDSYVYQQQEMSSLSDFASAFFQVTGPSYTVSTACSSATKALAAARRLLESNICDAVIVGGADTICDIIRNGFDSLELISQNRAIPFSKNRKGITLGTGGAIFLMSKEDLLHNNPPFLSGYGETSDASHISAPDPSGKMPEQAIHKALKMAKIQAENIDYINLHGTGSQLNDTMEGACIARLFHKTPISSTKALTGHTLGACGAVEAAFLWQCLMNIQNEMLFLPPHIYDNQPENRTLSLTKTNQSISLKKQINMLSNTFAFGGNNASVIISRSYKI